MKRGGCALLTFRDCSFSSCLCYCFGSDHFALFTELVFESGRDVQQNGLDANEEDLDWARDKADEHGVSKNDVPQLGGIADQ